ARGWPSSGRRRRRSASRAVQMASAAPRGGLAQGLQVPALGEERRRVAAVLGGAHAARRTRIEPFASGYPGRMSERHGPRGGGGAAGARRAWLAWWVLLSALFVVLSDSRRVEVLVLAVVVGAIGATATAMVRSHRDVVLRPEPRWVLHALRGFLAWPGDLVRLARALVVRPEGRIIEERFEATGEDPRDA